MTPDPVVVALLGVAAMTCFLVGLWIPAYARQRQMRKRLATFMNAGVAGALALDLGGRRRQRAPRRVRRGDPDVLTRFLERRIASAQVDATPNEVLGAMGILAALMFVVSALAMGNVGFGVLAAPLGAAGPVAWLSWRRRRLLARFEEQLIDTVVLLSSSVRAGHSLLQALDYVASEAPEPTRGAFALVVREIGLGASQESALERLADRYPSEDLELIVASVTVHLQVGGSLAKVLDAIGETIRDRTRIRSEVKALTAQQRFSTYVLSALPVFVGLAMWLISPDYIGIMFEHPLLRVALVGAACSVLLGYVVMRRIASIDV